MATNDSENPHRFSHDTGKKLLIKRCKNLKLNSVLFSLIMGFIIAGSSACGSEESESAVPSEVSAPASLAEENEEEVPTDSRPKGSRDNKAVCLVPTAPGDKVYENDFAHVDVSNSSEGYITVKYTGSSKKVKLQITPPNGITYTYNLSTAAQLDEVFPLQSGNGQYMVNVFENIEGTQYSMVFTQPVDVTLSNEFGPFLYPNQYVDFHADDKTVSKGEELAYPCNSDLDVVSEVYNYIINNISYDYGEAETVQSGYIPAVDEVLETKTGICLDYAALMTTMLRTQRIPTRMEIGYAGTAYHAWLSTYIKDVGWVNGMIEFDGKDWSLMDPTFASNTKEETLKDFIGDGKNYSVKYIY